MPFLLPPGSTLPAMSDGRADSCSQITGARSGMSEDELLDHLRAHALTCDDRRHMFGRCGCTWLRRDYFEHLLKTPDGRFHYWLNGEDYDHAPAGTEEGDLITVAYVELPNNKDERPSTEAELTIWAEIQTGGALEQASLAAVESFEQSHPNRDVHWFSNPEETQWLQDREKKKHG